MNIVSSGGYTEIKFPQGYAQKLQTELSQIIKDDPQRSLYLHMTKELAKTLEEYINMPPQEAIKVV